ncbi:MAG: hypothetical protein N0E40_21100 [Candidatus Thiodiazotropha taylori]|nr:hypothetical protein [Candidatus Thiodiazotropha taylori]MCW4306475.1 hypothetical protein [Candidatus Thiodiazotropha taylori]
MDNWFFELVLITVASGGVVWAVVKLTWFLVSVAEAVTTKTYAFLRDKADQKNDCLRDKADQEIDCLRDKADQEIDCLRSYKHEEKITELIKELEALEESVGISEKDVSLYSRCGFGSPIRIDPFESDAIDNDYLRYKVRRAYFSIQDIEKRKKLIELKRKVDKYWREDELKDGKEQMRSARNKLEFAKGYIKKYKVPARNELLAYWIFFSIPLCCLGYWLFVSEVVGVLAGVAGGFVVVKWAFLISYKDAVAYLNAAANELLYAKEALHRMKALQKVETFSSEEELNGERVRLVDEASHISAWDTWNRTKRAREFKRLAAWAKIVSPYMEKAFI